MSKVFGIGYSKTGTTSLYSALNILGYRTFRTDKNTFPHEPFDAATHEGAAFNFEDCDRLWPGGLFICTVREEEDWLRSYKRHMRFGRLWRLSFRGATSRTFAERYSCHMRRVNDHFVGRTDILYLDICSGEGWEGLCPFLGKPIPEHPFPAVNAGVGSVGYATAWLLFPKPARRLARKSKKRLARALMEV